MPGEDFRVEFIFHGIQKMKLFNTSQLLDKVGNSEGKFLQWGVLLLKLQKPGDWEARFQSEVLRALWRTRGPPGDVLRPWEGDDDRWGASPVVSSFPAYKSVNASPGPRDSPSHNRANPLIPLTHTRRFGMEGGRFDPGLAGKPSERGKGMKCLCQALGGGEDPEQATVAPLI